MWWVLLALGGCGAPADAPAEPTEEAPDPEPQGPPTSRGLVLYVEARGLVVQHDDTLGRLNPGVEHYAAPGSALVGLEPGQRVDLWLEPVEGGGRQVARLKVTGEPGLPEDFVRAGHPLQGTVIRVDGAEITVDHQAVEGVMDAMVMPFRVGARALSLQPGDQITARLLPSPYGWALADLQKAGTGDAALRQDIPEVQVGQLLPRTEVIAEDGQRLVLGAGQDRPTLITFIYTRCPDPTFCPALVSRLLSLQAQLDEGARLVTLTLDPAHDTPEVLARYGQGVGADPAIWRLGHLEPKALNALALRSGLAVTERDGRIAHLIRLLVLDAEGRLIERYDDNQWPLERVVGQLQTGGPVAERTGTRSVVPSPAGG